jgi:hypothetical protein
LLALLGGATIVVVSRLRIKYVAYLNQFITYRETGGQAKTFKVRGH